MPPTQPRSLGEEKKLKGFLLRQLTNQTTKCKIKALPRPHTRALAWGSGRAQLRAGGMGLRSSLGFAVGYPKNRVQPHGDG